MKKIDFKNGMFAIYNDEFENLVSKYKWTYHINSKSKQEEIITSVNGKTFGLGRFILNIQDDFKIALYKNNNKLDNRLKNLIVSDRSHQIARLTPKSLSGYKGVSYIKRDNKYRAGITIKNKYIHLGIYEFAKDAAEVYNKKAKELFGDLAYQNKIN